MMHDDDFVEAVKNMRNRTTRLEREGDYWTDDESGKLIYMFRTGVGLTEMALKLQRTEPAVSQQIEKLDLYERKENPRRKFFPKEPTCLCKNCKLDKRSCPNCKAHSADEEGA